MASQISNFDVVNITRSQSKAPSMAPEPSQVHRRVKKQPPQRSIEEFWATFTTKHPGKPFTLLPDNLYAKRAAAHAPKGPLRAVNAVQSYEAAVEACRAKVNKIVTECKRMNTKYRDPHFDIEADFKRSQLSPEIPPDCLTALNEEKTTFQPMSVKRIEVRYICCCVALHPTNHVRDRTSSIIPNSLSTARPRTMYDRVTMVTVG
jgi:hypothetical protein